MEIPWLCSDCGKHPCECSNWEHKDEFPEDKAVQFVLENAKDTTVHLFRVCEADGIGMIFERKDGVKIPALLSIKDATAMAMALAQSVDHIIQHNDYPKSGMN